MVSIIKIEHKFECRTCLEDERFLVDELLDLEVVLPIGLTAHDASVEWKRILERARRRN